MTHRDFRRDHRTAPTLILETCDCPGELELDEAIGDACDGHAVSVWRCLGCGSRVVWDETADLIRNDYPDPRRMVAGLAHQMKVRP